MQLYPVLQHSADPIRLYVPLGHGVGIDDPAGQKLFVGHITEVEIFEQKDPALHIVHIVFVFKVHD